MAMATLDGRQGAVDSTRQLAELAQAVVVTVLAMAEADMRAAHGGIPGGRFAIIGYGSLGGLELGFGSDLDLVFLHDNPAGVDASDGARPLEPGRWYARLAQKVMALLGAVTAAGRLYDIDVRLRPDGGKGSLVSSLASYTEYQRERAWTWEHQALVRARGVAGDASLLADFEHVRAQTLGRERDPATLYADVLKMRGRMRTELDRSDAARLDLKQGAGGVVDLEFLLQTGVLARSAQHAALLQPRDTPSLIDALAVAGFLPEDTAQALHGAHATLLDVGLACTLDRRPRLAPTTPAIEEACAAIAAACRAAALPFA
jgi:glutamate-ammonia-ligase adenylyltransferase